MKKLSAKNMLKCESSVYFLGRDWVVVELIFGQFGRFYTLKTNGMDGPVICRVPAAVLERVK